MKYIDNFLNGITMYKLILNGLMILASISVVFGFAGLLPYSGWSLAYTAIVLAIACYTSNYILAKLFKVQTNVESSSITAFILFFVLFPISPFTSVWMIVLVGVIAMTSKYIFVYHKKHIFNPVAISLFIVGLFGSGVVSWWVGSTVMLLPVLVFGLLVLRKVRRFELFFSFLVASLVSIFIFSLSHTTGFYDSVIQSFTSGPILFLGMIMLTEPMTTPPERKFQISYGVIVGALFGVQFHIGPLYSTPEFALIAGNLFSYIVSPRIRLMLTLTEKNKLSADVYEFVWKLDRKITFKAGQYLEWTLGHSNPDNRGNRRFFTIASSPTESELRLGIKFYDNSSSFKKKLLSLNPGDSAIASQLAGDFTLPKDSKKKLVFIAGGIGVTPFRSIVKYLVDTNDKRDMVLFYSNRTPKDIVYKDLFDEAGQKVGLKTVYAVNDLAGSVASPNMPVGFINADMIMKEVPDYKDRQFYISGPHGMVSAFENTLGKMGISKNSIKVDFFPGFV